MKPIVKQVQDVKFNEETIRVKHRTCYTCREKGNFGKDCPKGNLPKSKLVHYDFAKLGRDKAGTYAIRVIDSPRTSIRAIWIPKHLVTKRVFGSLRLILSPVTSNVSMPIRKTKHKLIIKLTA
jgi:hypothetical protein